MHNRRLVILFAIAVTLALVLFSTINYYLLPRDEFFEPTASVTKEKSLTNWTLRISRISPGMLISWLNISVKKADSTIGLNTTPLNKMMDGGYYSGVRFVKYVQSEDLAVGDYFTLDTAIYKEGSIFIIRGPGGERAGVPPLLQYTI